MTEEDTEQTAEEKRFYEAMKEHLNNFPKQHRPCILVCGGTGSGKSTTINTLFTSEVAKVGHYARGTSTSELYEWVSRGAHITVVDLPGLGDSKDRDREYREMYRRHVSGAHGFIVVTTPPRPASLPTLRTVKLLLSCGVPARNITFAFNRLSLLNVTIDGEMRPVSMNSLGGPVEEKERQVIDHARLSFFADLCTGTGTSEFSLDQIVPYDALTGWNLFGVLNSVVATLPVDTRIHWANAVNQSAQAVVDRHVKTSKRARERIAELEEEIARLETAGAHESAKVEALRKQIKSDRARVERGDREAVKTLASDKEHKKKIVDQFADYLDGKGMKTAATVVRTVRDTARAVFSLFR